MKDGAIEVISVLSTDASLARPGMPRDPVIVGVWLRLDKIDIADPGLGLGLGLGGISVSVSVSVTASLSTDDIEVNCRGFNMVESKRELSTDE
jgi:hypothetical protein